MDSGPEFLKGTSPRTVKSAGKTHLSGLTTCPRTAATTHNSDATRQVGEAEDGLEQLAHSLIGNSFSLLLQDQDIKGAEGFEVRIPLFGTADGSFVIDGDQMPATFRQGETHCFAITGPQQRGVVNQEFELQIGLRFDSFEQPSFLLDQPIRRLEKDFLKKGGLRENMTKARLDYRRKNQ